MYLDADGEDEDNADLVTPEDYKDKISGNKLYLYKFISFIICI